MPRPATPSADRAGTLAAQLCSAHPHEKTASEKPEPKKLASDKLSRSDLIERLHAVGLVVGGRKWVPTDVLEARLAAPHLHRVMCIASNGALVALQRCENFSVRHLKLIRDNFAAIGPPNKATIKKWRLLLGTRPALDSHLYSKMRDLIHNSRGPELSGIRKRKASCVAEACSSDTLSKREAKRLCRKRGLKLEGTKSQLLARLRHPSEHSVKVQTSLGFVSLHKTQYVSVKHLRIIRDNFPKLGHITHKNVKEWRVLLGRVNCTDAHLFGVTGVLRPCSVQAVAPAPIVAKKMLSSSTNEKQNTPPLYPAFSDTPQALAPIITPFARKWTQYMNSSQFGAKTRSQKASLGFKKQPISISDHAISDAPLALSPAIMIPPTPDLRTAPNQTTQPPRIGLRRSLFTQKGANTTKGTLPDPKLCSQKVSSAFMKQSPKVISPPQQTMQPPSISLRRSPFAQKWADYMKCSQLNPKTRSQKPSSAFEKQPPKVASLPEQSMQPQSIILRRSPFAQKWADYMNGTV